MAENHPKTPRAVAFSDLPEIKVPFTDSAAAPVRPKVSSASALRAIDFFQSSSKAGGLPDGT